MKKISLFYLVFLCGFSVTLIAQKPALKLGNNPATINSNSVLEMESTNKGMLLPRVALTATTSAAPLSAHVAGMMVYNTADAGTGTTAVAKGSYYNDGTQWNRLAQSNSSTTTNPYSPTAEDPYAGACGAFIAPGVYKRFLCHNLGADITLDPHVPVVGIHGAFIQWGRRGPNYTQDAKRDWFIAPSDGPNGFVAAPTAINGRNAGPADGWAGLLTSTTVWNNANHKTIHDPCPYGYRVPNNTEWQGVIANNLTSLTGTFTSSVTNFGSARRFGNATTAVTLTLPTNGARSYNVGLLESRGAMAQYWASTTDPGNNGYAGTFISTDIELKAGNFPNAGYKGIGLPVRCIEDYN